MTALELIEEVLSDPTWRKGSETAKLARMLKLAIEQRDRYFAGQHHGLGYSLEEDNAELDRIACE